MGKFTIADSLVNIVSSAVIRAMFAFIDANDAVMGVLIGEVAGDPDGNGARWLEKGDGRGRWAGLVHSVSFNTVARRRMGRMDEQRVFNGQEEEEDG